MKSPEINNTPRYFVEDYHLPEDGDWQDVDEVPDRLRKMVELHMMARADGDYVDEVHRQPVSLDEIYDTYDDWGRGQHVLAVFDGNAPIGMTSYYYDPQGRPFIESVAVDPSTRGHGVGGQLIDTVLEQVARESDADWVTLRAHGRVAAMYERKWQAQALLESDRGVSADLITMVIPVPRHDGP